MVALPCALFDAGAALYDCRSALLVSIPDVQVHLRNHEYFMELSANIDPIKGIVTTNCAAAVARGSLTDEEHRSPQLVLQGADIAAHRMFGPQPQTSTYICIWDFVVGRIKAELSVDDVLLLARIGTVFGASLDDDDNPLQPHLMLATDPDITFLTARIAPFEVSVTGEERATMHLSTAQDATVRLDDSPCERFLRHVEVDVPRIDAQALLPVSPTSDHFVAVASAETDLLLSIAGTSSNWAAVKERKLAFIEKQDALTSRCAFLYATGGQVVPAASHYSPVELPSFADRRGVHHSLRSRLALTAITQRTWRLVLVSAPKRPRARREGHSPSPPHLSCQDPAVRGTRAMSH
jgi:hypothetical protein